MNNLWGSLCEKYTTKVRRQIDDEEHAYVIDDCEVIKKIRVFDEDNKTPEVSAKLMNLSRVFKRSDARVGIFLTAYARYKMMQIVKPFLNNVTYINTDGFETTIDISDDLDIGSNLGQFKMQELVSLD